MTAPWACLASLPVSKRRVLSLIVSSRVVIKNVLKVLNGSKVPGFQNLFSDVETLDQIRVSMCVFQLEVIEQPAALADQHQQAAAGMMILGVRFEVFRQIVDALA